MTLASSAKPRVKAPTRRQIATAVSRTISVLNGQSQNQDVLKAEMDALSARLTALESQSRWQRLRWVLGL